MKIQTTPFKLLFVLLTLTALVLTACGASGGTGGGVPSEAPVAGDGGSPTISKELSLDPANATDADSLMVIGYVYEPLFKVEGDTVAPVLAESYTVTDDGLDYIVVLRKGVTVHDGSPFNADAVIANFDRWFKTDNSAHGSAEYAAWVSNFGGFQGEMNADGKPKSNVDGIEKVDAYTVLIHLNAPDSQFLAKLANPAFSMVSPAALGAAGFGTATGKSAGTGNYQIASWSDTGLTLEPYAGYWGTPATDALELPFK